MELILACMQECVLLSDAAEYKCVHITIFACSSTLFLIAKHGKNDNANRRLVGTSDVTKTVTVCGSMLFVSNIAHHLLRNLRHHLLLFHTHPKTLDSVFPNILLVPIL